MADREEVTPSDLQAPAALLLVALSLVGLATLVRLVKRNVVSDQYKTAMDSIRAVFRASDPKTLGAYNPFVRARILEPDKHSARKIWGVLPAGLTLLVMTINAILLTGAGVALTDLEFEHQDATLITAVVSFVVLVGVQVLFVDFLEGSLKGDAKVLGSPELADVYKRGGIGDDPSP